MAQPTKAAVATRPPAAPIAQKRDLRKELKALYSAPAGIAVVVDVPAMNYLMVDGAGDPNTSPVYPAAIEALYGVSYTLKFMLKRGPEAIDYSVMPLEGLWWADNMAEFAKDKSKWMWTAMITQPGFISNAHVKDAIASVLERHPSGMLHLLRFETMREGRVAQLLHVGPYSTEGPNIAKLHAFIAAQGGRLRGKHHEIYLGDPRRSAPEKLKTIIRQPFEI